MPVRRTMLGFSPAIAHLQQFWGIGRIGCSFFLPGHGYTGAHTGAPIMSRILQFFCILQLLQFKNPNDLGVFEVGMRFALSCVGNGTRNDSIHNAMSIICVLA